MNLFQEYKNIDVKRIAKYIKVNINRFRYIRLGMKGRNRHKVIAVGYAAAIGVAFILSLTNRSDRFHQLYYAGKRAGQQHRTSIRTDNISGEVH